MMPMLPASRRDQGVARGRGRPPHFGALLASLRRLPIVVQVLNLPHSPTRPHLHLGLLFGMIKKFREYSFLLLRYHCECSQSGRG